VTQRISASASRLSTGWLLFLALAIVACVLILTLASGLSFQGDEWAYIVLRRLTVDGLLRPHNEHLAALHVLVYRGMVELIGIDSYFPYQVVLLLLHVTAAALLLVLLSRHLPRAGAMAAAVLFLFLGTGFDNLLWAFQIGFVGAVVFGLGALIVADRPWLAAILLTASIWTQSDGLFFVAPLAILMRNRVSLILPIGSYLAWLVLVGRQYIASPASGPYVDYVVHGIGAAFGGVTGVALPIGLLVAGVVAIAIVVQAIRRGHIEPIVLAGLAGLASEFVVLAIGRAHFGSSQAEAPRYIYVAAPFIFMLLPSFRWVPRVAWIGIFSIALLLNLNALPRGVAIYHAFLNYDRSQTMEERIAPYR
jgi:hypothetical protein